jgi:LacI family transcriptional regulator
MKDNIIICLLCSGTDHAIQRKIAKGLIAASEERNYNPISGVVPIDSRSEVRRLVNMFGDKISGIAIQPYRPNRELAEVLLTPPVKNIHNIIIGHYYDNLQCNACVIDNFGGMYAATEHLIRCGRKRLAFLGEISLSSTEFERYLGFVHACLHHGIKVPSEFIIRQSFETNLRNVFKSIFFSEESPDALVCQHDGVAPSALRVLHDLGIQVPEQVAVISFGDDLDIADDCDPPLSTAYHPAEEMGRVAAHQLINQIEGKIPSMPSIFVLPVGMHIRRSSGTPDTLLHDGKHCWDVPFSAYIGTCTRLDEVSK